MGTLRKSLVRLGTVATVTTAVIAGLSVGPAAATRVGSTGSGSAFAMTVDSVSVNGAGIVSRNRTVTVLPSTNGASVRAPANCPIPLSVGGPCKPPKEPTFPPPPPPPPPPSTPPPGTVVVSDCASTNLYYQIVQNGVYVVVEWAFHYTWCWAILEGSYSSSITYVSAVADPPRIYDTYWSRSTDTPARSEGAATVGGLPGYTVTFSGVQFSYCYSLPFNLCLYFNPVIVADMAVQGLFIYNRSNLQ